MYNIMEYSFRVKSCICNKNKNNQSAVLFSESTGN